MMSNSFKEHRSCVHSYYLFYIFMTVNSFIHLPKRNVYSASFFNMRKMTEMASASARVVVTSSRPLVYVFPCKCCKFIFVAAVHEFACTFKV